MFQARQRLSNYAKCRRRCAEERSEYSVRKPRHCSDSLACKAFANVHFRLIDFRQDRVIEPRSLETRKPRATKVQVYIALRRKMLYRASFK